MKACSKCGVAKAPIVCGLHNEFNLQVLPAKVNIAKGNRPSNVAGIR
jgi:hypothetical protein